MSQQQPKSGYAYLKSQYFALAGAIRKALTGNGRDTSNNAAEVLIATATVRNDKNQIFFKESVTNLRETLSALTANAA